MFEHARDIILVIDADDGQILDANRAAEACLQVPPAPSCSRGDPRSPGRAEGFADQMRLAERPGSSSTLHRRRDGSPFAVEVSSRGDMMSGRRCLFSIIRDITERKRFEVEREELPIATQRALQLRDDFLRSPRTSSARRSPTSASSSSSSRGRSIAVHHARSCA
ncbi:MAG: PAS domain-containing protein [Myxococcales bacterium]|nr:PAS domain-containing protein [Myxococcales bacterium]